MNDETQCVPNPLSPRELELLHLYLRLDRALARIERGVRALQRAIDR